MSRPPRNMAGVSGPPDLTIRPLADDERPWLADHLQRAWGATAIVSGGVVHDAAALPALVAVRDGTLAGVATLHHSPTPSQTEPVTIDALRFYQRRGLRLAALHRGAVDEARRLKPAIPVIGEHGIPLHDELELELAG